MSEKVLVGGSLRRWDARLAIVSAVGCGASAIVFARELPQSAELALYATGGVLLVVGAVTLWRRYTARVWAFDTGSSLELFDCTGNHRTATIRDEEVGSVAVTEEPKLGFQGDHVAALVRRMRLRTLGDDGQVRVVSLVTQFAPDQADPLQSYVERVLIRLSEAAKGVLARGGALPGDGWQLTASVLKVGDMALPLGQAKAAAALDKHVCVWFNDDERPAARIKQDGWNAWLLLTLLDERLKDVPPAEPSHEHLGRILYERKSSRSQYVTAIVVMLLVTSLPLGGLFDRDLSPLIRGLLLAGSGLGVVFLIFWILSLRKSIFRCHEGGVYHATLFTERRLMFKDAVAFTYAATRMYHNGVYGGTVVRFDLEPAGGRKEDRIVYNAAIRNADEMLESLREHIAAVIGRRMAEFVAAGERVPWTNSVAFHRDQLLVTTGGLIRAKTEKSVPIRDVATYRMNDGVLDLLVEGQSSPLVSINSHESNFFPGFACLTILVQQAETPGTPTTARSSS